MKAKEAAIGGLTQITNRNSGIGYCYVSTSELADRLPEQELQPMTASDYSAGIDLSEIPGKPLRIVGPVRD